MARRRYLQTIKAEAVGLAEVIGIPAAAETMGIPESSIRTWREKPDFAELRAEKKDDVTADVWAAFQIGVRRIAELLPDATDLGKVAIATGVIYDKFALMSGDATTRTETLSLTDGLSADEKRNLRRVFDRVAAAEREESGAS